MFDRVLQIQLDGPHRDPKGRGNLALWHVLQPGEDENAPTAFRQFGHGLAQQSDIGAVLDDPSGVRPIVRNFEQSVETNGRGLAPLGPPQIGDDIQRDADQIGARVARRSDIGSAEQAQIALRERFSSEVSRSNPTRQTGKQLRIIFEQQVTQRRTKIAFRRRRRYGRDVPAIGWDEIYDNFRHFLFSIRVKHRLGFILSRSLRQLYDSGRLACALAAPIHRP